MYLSRAELDPTRRETMVALISPQKFHGAVENAFPGALRKIFYFMCGFGV